MNYYVFLFNGKIISLINGLKIKYNLIGTYTYNHLKIISCFFYLLYSLLNNYSCVLYTVTRIKFHISDSLKIYFQTDSKLIHF